MELYRFDHQQVPSDSPWSARVRLAMLAWSYAWPLLCRWTPKPANRWRLFVLRRFGAKIHGRPFIHQRARIHIPWHLTMYDGSALGDRANAYSLGEIEIAQGATIAQEAYLCTGTHDLLSPAMNLMVGKITVGRNAFVGARAFILPGVTIGSDAVVGACSVISRSVESGHVVVGSPGRIIGRRNGVPE
ncbi:CysE/LacA/LpxA/NodL family acetyltransferase [Sphingomonas sp. LH128]|uniref:DapH/DapD/GlmU-related protein n=1 Tax=Sphingomonas sp. LH128 TaxID=473781 RepID=UPI00027CAAA0|nr:DapH/DapD/GlmU-related protein [Sphingomonas sp. LH128]EJU14589.1 CysE/LacA/LpxA/NodL family acetyltransferase [Sphingomonas sp. LH128]